MKQKLFFLIVAALLCSFWASAKTVRGFVYDVDGNPVSNVKMVIVNLEKPGTTTTILTNEEGFFCVQVPDNIDTDDPMVLFARGSYKVLRYHQTSTGVRVVVDRMSKDTPVLSKK